MQCELIEQSCPPAQTGPEPVTRFREAVANGLPLGRIGNLVVRLARGADEIMLAQEVRYRVFHEEMGAMASMADRADRRDADLFDDICDHLLVIDTSLPGGPLQGVVGTYRLLRAEAATGGFYSSSEFELGSLVRRQTQHRFLELGRSCVLPEYRSKRTIEVLWQGIWAYVRHHGISVMAGCASFPGIWPAAHAQALSFLAHNCRTEPEWDVRALPHRYVSMDLMPTEAIDPRAALAAMPPLVKGYLRLGAKVGDGCVVDREFGTTDVFIVLPVETISPRYVAYYGADAQRFQA